MGEYVSVPVSQKKLASGVAMHYFVVPVSVGIKPLDVPDVSIVFLLCPG